MGRGTSRAANSSTCAGLIEARYFAQIRRFHHEQRDLFEPAPSPTYDSLSFEDDLPF